MREAIFGCTQSLRLALLALVHVVMEESHTGLDDLQLSA